MSAHNLLPFLGWAHLLSCGLLAMPWGGSHSGAGRPKHPRGEEPVAASPFAAAAQAATAKKTRVADDVTVMRADAGGIVPSVHNWSCTCVACTFEHNGAVMYLRS